MVTLIISGVLDSIEHSKIKPEKRKDLWSVLAIDKVPQLPAICPFLNYVSLFLTIE